MGKIKVKINWAMEQDIVDTFDEWTEQKGMGKSVSAQLGLWIIMHLDAKTRDACMELMQSEETRTSANISLSYPPTAQTPKKVTDKFENLCDELGLIKSRAITTALILFSCEAPESITSIYLNIEESIANISPNSENENVGNVLRGKIDEVESKRQLKKDHG